jgi:glycosyltransferase involved in cell wall biosynthesis
MELFLQFVVLIAGYCILHTYLFYPWWTTRAVSNHKCSNTHYLGKQLLAQAKADDFKHKGGFKSPDSAPAEVAGQLSRRKEKGDVLPRVSVLMAVHNEEKVLVDKLECLLAQDYPGQLEIWIGSDNSSDGTNNILRHYAQKDERLNIQLFTSRQGKPGIINQLSRRTGALNNQHFFLLTDASVMLAPDVVSALILPTLDLPDLSVVDARMIHTGMQEIGIGKAEDRYISGEVKLKQAEGQLWGYMMGPFGGCYALRSDHFRPVPPNFLVDDFFLCLSAYELGGKGISSSLAHCYEGVGQQMAEEFRRKVRISSGNWQNAVRFRKLWWPPNRTLAYAFFSHKILRWLTPFLMLTILFGLGLLAIFFGNYLAALAFSLFTAAIIIPLILDPLLVKVFGVHWQTVRAIRYFLAMNLALLVGFFRYLKGIQSNVWQPSQRH